MALKLESDLDCQDVARITNLPSPSADNDAVRRIDLTNAVEALKNKDGVLVGTGSNINLASPGATLDGETMAEDDRVLVRGQTDEAENGIYIFNGAATPMTRSADASTAEELNNATVGVAEGSDAGVVYRQIAVVGTLDTDDVIWETFGSTTPDASTTAKGKIEIATDTEVNTGTDTERAITPAGLAQWEGRYQAGGTLIGDGSATQFDVTHNYATRDVSVTVVAAASPYDGVLVEWKAQTTNAVRINFASAPSSGEYRVLIQKIG